MTSQQIQLWDTQAPLEGRRSNLVSQRRHRAAELGVPIHHLGMHPLFDEVRVYQGIDRDWLLSPMHLDPIWQSGGDFPIPRTALRSLKVLVNGGLDLPHMYTAHDIAQGAADSSTFTARAHHVAPSLAQRRPLLIQPPLARTLVSVPAPTRTLEWSQRLGVVVDSLLHAVFRVATVTVGMAAAPLLVGSSAFSDPILFGAVPLIGETSVGTSADWFVIASWTY
jgi:hypothetical protein